MMKIRKANERGHAEHGWLDTYHTFSFDTYHDPQHMQFRGLRVLNEDRVAPGHGFPMHPHRDMEIITYVLEGALEHQDSMGNRGIIRPGEAQRMSAGTGVVHSERNPSPSEPVHLLQIWILPGKRGIAPGYEQKTFPPEELRGRLRLIAAPNSSDGAVTIHTDARVYAGRLAKGEETTHTLAAGRGAWVQVARGSVEVNGTPLKQGDGALIADEQKVVIRATGDAEILLFDLA